MTPCHRAWGPVCQFRSDGGCQPLSFTRGLHFLNVPPIALLKQVFFEEANVLSLEERPEQEQHRDVRSVLTRRRRAPAAGTLGGNGDPKRQRPRQTLSLRRKQNPAPKGPQGSRRSACAAARTKHGEGGPREEPPALPFRRRLRRPRSVCPDLLVRSLRLQLRGPEGGKAET